MAIEIIHAPISRKELGKMAYPGFGNIVKAVVDIRREIIAVGGELHADEEVALFERCGSKREEMWGINFYTDKLDEEFVEFDSMINLKPAQNNRSRGVESEVIRAKIMAVVRKLITG